ncbi:MAG: AI-2E family transporter, partial [Methylocella sp.]
MGNEKAAVTIVMDAGQNRFVIAVFAAVLVSAALYLGRVVFEPIAFTLFVMALVEPFQKAVEARMGKPVALVLTIILTLLFLSILVWAIVWSISDIVDWGLANTERFQSLYMRTTLWLIGHDLVVGDFESLKPSSFVGMFQAIAGYVNYILGFALMVFLFLIFGLSEMGDFRLKLATLDTKLSSWSLLETSGEIAEKFRKYMLMRTLASVATGLAVFLFTLAIGLDLAIAWGVISFVLNYIPYLGPIVAVIFP